MNVLISGPIRPSEESVLELISAVRNQFSDCRIFLSTWSESKAIRDKVDVYQCIPEPTDADIALHVKAKTLQHVENKFPDNAPGCKFSTYKMIFGVQNVCELAGPYLKDSDKVMRLRTDSVFLFEPTYFASLLTSTAYVAKKGDGFDWFALTTFGVLKQVWCFKNLYEYNERVSKSWNPEDVVRGRVPIPIEYLDTSKVDCYILRPNGYKQYY